MTEDEARKKVCRNVPLFPIQTVGGAQMVSPNCVASACAIWDDAASRCGLIRGDAVDRPRLLGVQ